MIVSCNESCLLSLIRFLWLMVMNGVRLPSGTNWHGAKVSRYLVCSINTECLKENCEKTFYKVVQLLMFLLESLQIFVFFILTVFLFYNTLFSVQAEFDCPNKCVVFQLMSIMKVFVDISYVFSLSTAAHKITASI